MHPVCRSFPIIVLAISLAAGEPTPAGLKAQVAALAADIGQIHRTVEQELDRLHGGKPVLLIELTMERCLLEQPAVLSLMRSPVLPLRGRLLATGLTTLAAPVEAPGVVITGDATAGTAKGTLTACLDRGPAWDLSAQEKLGSQLAVTADLTLDLRWKDGRLGGTWKIVPMPPPSADDGKRKEPPPLLPSRQGEAAGNVTSLDHLAGQGQAPTISESQPRDLYQAACRLETEADRSYALMRSLLLVRRKGLDWPQAVAAAPAPQVERPAIAFDIGRA